jgi:DNA-binding response OmpR family regulator
VSAVFLTSDLMISSTVTGAADRAGVELRVVGSVDTAIEKCQSSDSGAPAGVNLVIVDLSLPGLRLEELVEAIEAGSATRPKIVAFGPHVHALRLDAARQAGCDEVMSRGQFHTAAEDVLKRFG